jgi:hypothetical protein
MPEASLKYHFLTTRQFVFNALDDNIEVSSLMYEIEVIAANGENGAEVKIFDPLLIKLF